MKALVLKQVKSPLMLEERPDLTPAADEVVIRIKAAALNRRDYWITQGLYPGIEPPVVLGSDGAGVVTQCGSGVQELWEGRAVIVNPGCDWGDRQSVQSDGFTILGLPRDGTLATEVVVPASQVFDKPASMSWEEAAAVPLGGVTAYRAVYSQGELRAGENVLVTGIGGGVATFALQLALAGGADVWVTSSSAEKIERAVEMGARGGFDYRDDGWWKRAARDAGPMDLIIDSAGGGGYRALVDLAAPGGRIVSYGATAGPAEKLDLFKVFWKQLRLQGSTMGSPADFSAMLDFATKHGVRPVVDRVFPLADANEALALMAGSPQFGKYVLSVDDQV